MESFCPLPSFSMIHYRDHILQNQIRSHSPLLPEVVAAVGIHSCVVVIDPASLHDLDIRKAGKTTTQLLKALHRPRVEPQIGLGKQQVGLLQINHIAAVVAIIRKDILPARIVQ